MAKTTPPSSSTPAEAPTTPVKGTKTHAPKAQPTAKHPKLPAARKAPAASATHTKPVKRPQGRQPAYSPVMAREICEEIAKGIPLTHICAERGIPPRAVYAWLELNRADFGADFARAREVGFDALAEQCLQIADDERHDWVLSQKGEVLNESAIGRAKLRVETRLKLLAKWSPKRYGERLEHTGSVELTFEQRLLQLSATPVPGHASPPDAGD